MTAYYNEHDPAAVAWLRELITSGPTHLASSSFDREGDGMLDIAPKLTRAICNSVSCGARRVAVTLAYGQLQEPAILHTIHRSEAHFDSRGKIVAGCYQARSFLAFAIDRLPPSPVDVSETCAPILRVERDDTPASISTLRSVQGHEETTCRIGDKYLRRRAFCHAICCSYFCISPSRTFLIDAGLS